MWCDVWCLCVHTLPFVELGLSTFEHLEFHHLDLWTKNFLEEFLTCLSFAYAAFRYYHNSKSPVNESLAVLLHILADLQSFVWFTGFLSCQGWAAYIVSLVLISLYYRPELAKKYKTSLYGRDILQNTLKIWMLVGSTSPQLLKNSQVIYSTALSDMRDAERGNYICFCAA